jgi:hypothetical protein
MTKEDKAKAIVNLITGHAPWSNWNGISRSNIERSIANGLSEFAKQQAIAFANFIAQHDYKPHNIDTWDDGRKNTYEVYDDFIEFQRIEQQTKDK